jgi:hypothetical protein
MDLKWFYYLNNEDKKSLLNNKRKEDNNIIVCKELESRQFAIFENYLKLRTYVREIDVNKRCLYEIIQKDDKRKIYFDIETKEPEYLNDDFKKELIFNIKNAIKQEIKKEYKEEDIKIKEYKEEDKNKDIKIKEDKEEEDKNKDIKIKEDKNKDIKIKEEDKEEDIKIKEEDIKIKEEDINNIIILVYNSSVKDKLSYHIIVTNYYLCNNDESKCFYDKIMERLDEKYRKFVDPAVYSTVQQFRIVGCSKYKKNNFKIIDESLSENLDLLFKDEIHLFSNSKNLNSKNLNKEEEFKKKILFKASLISMTNEDCVKLEGYSVKKEKNNFMEKGCSDEKDVEKALDLLNEKYDKIFKPMDKKEKDGNYLITLKRRKPSYCERCKRTHESENAYMLIVGEFKTVILDCRRNDKEKKEWLGNLVEGGNNDSINLRDDYFDHQEITKKDEDDFGIFLKLKEESKKIK